MLDLGGYFTTPRVGLLLARPSVAGRSIPLTVCPKLLTPQPDAALCRRRRRPATGLTRFGTNPREVVGPARADRASKRSMWARSEPGVGQGILGIESQPTT